MMAAYRQVNQRNKNCTYLTVPIIHLPKIRKFKGVKEIEITFDLKASNLYLFKIL